MRYFDPQCTPVIVKDAQQSASSFPPYVVESVSMVEYLEDEKALNSKESFCLKIMDFGNGESLTPASYC